MKKNIFYLTGFMGAGKTTIGPILANTLGWEFIDLDKKIEDITGKKIREIFNESGEPVFRKLETEALLGITSAENLIVSLGGGTISSGENLSILQKSGYIIYLRTTVEAVYKRLIHKNDRPVLNMDNLKDLPPEEIIKKINTIFETRRPFYEKADIIIDTEGSNLGRTVDKLASIIENKIRGNRIEKSNC